MSDYNNAPRQKTPLWVTVVIILCMLPVLAFPSLLSMTTADTTTRTFVWLYPFYVICSGICAWICWPQRRDVMWILLALMVLSHLAMWLLVLNGNLLGHGA